MKSVNVFSAPIIFTLDNTSFADQDCIIFMPSMNRASANNGLPPGVNLTFNYTTNNYNYAQLLAEAEDSPYRLWKFRYDIIKTTCPNGIVIPSPIPQVDEIFHVVKKTSTGGGGVGGFNIQYPLFPYRDLDQTAANSREFRHNLIIDPDIGIKFLLKACYALKFMFWVDKDVALVNKLNNLEHHTHEHTSVHTHAKPFPLEEKNPYLVRIIYKEDSIGFLD